MLSSSVPATKLSPEDVGLCKLVKRADIMLLGIFSPSQRTMVGTMQGEIKPMDYESESEQEEEEEEENTAGSAATQ